MSCFKFLIRAFPFLLVELACEACTCFKFYNLPKQAPHTGRLCVKDKTLNSQPVYWDQLKGHYLYYTAANETWEVGTKIGDSYLRMHQYYRKKSLELIIHSKRWQVKLGDGSFSDSYGTYIGCVDGRDEPEEENRTTSAPIGTWVEENRTTSALIACAGIIVFTAGLLYGLKTRLNIGLCGWCRDAVCHLDTRRQDRWRRGGNRGRGYTATAAARPEAEVRDWEDATLDIQGQDSDSSAPRAGNAGGYPASAALQASSVTCPTAPPPGYDQAVDMPRPPPSGTPHPPSYSDCVEK